MTEKSWLIAEHAYRRGFQHGFGVGSQDEGMCFIRLPTFKEVTKWRFELIDETDPILGGPGTVLEGKKVGISIENVDA